MRLNKQELLTLASQPSQNFDREGIIIIKERQDGFFRRSEGCCARWFRLRGNLLFYLRGTEPLTEPMGMIILGQHSINIQPQDENGHWPFQILWNNGACYKMATYLECERTMWLQAIESAPYNIVKSKICTLQEKVSKIQPKLDIFTWRQQRGILVDMNEVPLCELALCCDNLLCDAYGLPPSPLIVVNVKYTKAMCVRYDSTEVIDRCSNPSFCRTILFRSCDCLTGDSVVQIVVYDMREIVSETMVPLGYATLLLNTIQEAQRLRVALKSADKRHVGFVTLNAWSLEPSLIGASPTHGSEQNSVDIAQKKCHRRSVSLPPRLGVKLKFPSVGNVLKHNLMNSHHVSYRFHSGLGGDITVHEIMAESRLCFQMPIQLLDIFVRREKDLLQELISLGEMTGQWRNRQFELISIHTSVLKRYWRAKKSLRIYSEDKYFKESAKKGETSLEFAPTNLHMQRMWVHNDTLNRTGVHDIVTAGAFAVHQGKTDRTGGLIKLVQQVKDINDTTAPFISATSSKIQSDYENILVVKKLRDECAETAQALANKIEGKMLESAASLLDSLIANTRSLCNNWDAAAVDEELNFIKHNKSGTTGLVVNEAKPKVDTTIQKLTEQLNILEMNSEMDAFELSSGCSSKDASPTVDGPMLSASVPNINKSLLSQHSLVEVRDLLFCHDYFKQETMRDKGERCSSLRISKRKMDELQKNSLDMTALRQNRTPVDLRVYFKRSSLEQEPYSSDVAETSLTYNHQDSGGSDTAHGSAHVAHGQTTTQDNAEPARGSAEPARGSTEPARRSSGMSASLVADVEERLAAATNTAQTLLNQVWDEESRIELVARLRSALFVLGGAVDALLSALRAAHAAARMRGEAAEWARASAALHTRRDACLSQALTTASTGLLCWLWSCPTAVVAQLLTAGLGPLCCFEGLLSLFAEEIAMWGDMVVAVEDLHTVVFTLVNHRGCADPTPQVRGSRGALNVLLPVSESLYNKIENKEHLSFTVTAVLFNVGINEKASAAEALGDTAPQRRSNRDGCARMHRYYLRHRRLFAERAASANRASSRNMPIEEVMESLRVAVDRGAPKDVDILYLAALATRLMDGVRFTSCKSAKDRTGMSTTLEQCRVLAAEYHLADHQMATALRVMRSEGCRRENALKNIGINKYAFTKKQVAALPQEYRPPAGTYGATHT